MGRIITTRVKSTGQGSVECSNLQVTAKPSCIGLAAFTSNLAVDIELSLASPRGPTTASSIVRTDHFKQVKKCCFAFDS